MVVRFGIKYLTKVKRGTRSRVVDMTPLQWLLRLTHCHLIWFLEVICLVYIKPSRQTFCFPRLVVIISVVELV